MSGEGEALSQAGLDSCAVHRTHSLINAAASAVRPETLVFFASQY